MKTLSNADLTYIKVIEIILPSYHNSKWHVKLLYVYTTLSTTNIFIDVYSKKSTEPILPRILMHENMIIFLGGCTF